MKLSQAIDVYIQRRRATGAYLRVPEFILRAFLRLCGDVELRHIRRPTVEKFLRGPRPIQPGTVRGRHSALKMFFAYWVLRGRIRRTPLPKNAPKRTHLFVPYIYSHAELRRLLETADRCQQRPGCKISGATLRALLLLLYGTGMRVGEVLGAANQRSGSRERCYSHTRHQILQVAARADRAGPSSRTQRISFLGATDEHRTLPPFSVEGAEANTARRCGQQFPITARNGRGATDAAFFISASHP